MFTIKKDPKTKTREEARARKREETRLRADLLDKERLHRLLSAELQRHVQSNNRYDGERTASRIASVEADIIAIKQSITQREQMVRVAENASRAAGTMAAARAMDSTLERVARTVQPVSVARLNQNIERNKDKIEQSSEMLSELFQADDEEMIGDSGESAADVIFQRAFANAIPDVPMSAIPSVAPAVHSYSNLDSLQSRFDALER